MFYCSLGNAKACIKQNKRLFLFIEIPLGFVSQQKLLLWDSSENSTVNKSNNHHGMSRVCTAAEEGQIKHCLLAASPIHTMEH